MYSGMVGKMGMTDKEILQMMIRAGGACWMDQYRCYSREELNQTLNIELPGHILYVQKQLDSYGWVSKYDSHKIKKQWGLDENNIMKS